MNSLLNLDLLTLLQGNQVARIPFSPNGTLNRITVRYNSLLNVQLTQSLDLYGITRGPARPVVSDAFTQNARICAGSTASLLADTTPGTELVWYSQATGGTPIAVTAAGTPFVTPALQANTSYYVSARRTGCTEESARIRINVSVVALPTASDIAIGSPLSACSGNNTLAPTSNIGGATFKYYKDQQKTQEVTTGFTGDAGVTYVKNETTGTLAIAGLSAANSPYQYYISITVEGLCENAANTLRPVTVNYAATLALQTQASLSGCGFVNLSDAIVNLDSSGDIVYHFYDSNNVELTADAAANITQSGTFSIQAESISGACTSALQQVAVTVNAQPELNIPDGTIVANLGSTVTLNATANAPITWYDPAGNALPGNTFGPLASAGTYVFTAVASNGSCSDTGILTVNVIDPANCPPLTERVYAQTQSWSSIVTGGVANAALAIDGNPQTFSTVTTGLGLLGIGTTWQTLQWNNTVASGTPLTVKLGSEYSALIVAGAYSVVGTKRNASGVPVDIGPLQPVSGSLANLLSGENVFEFTFVPADATGPKAYDGVRIIVGSVLSVAQSVRVYEAYYNRTVTQVACSGQDVLDVFSGAIDLGVGVATATVGVADPFQSVDSNIATFATMFSGAGVLAAADLTVAFRTPALPGDSVAIILSRPSTLLNLGLLSGFSIQMYNGNVPVTPAIDNSSSLLSLTLLGGGNARLVVAPQTVPFDRIKIRFGGVATVLDQIRVHEIVRFANTSVVGADETNTINACQGQTLTLAVTPEPCTTYVWYDAETGGNVVSTGTSFTVPMNLAAGTYTYYIQPVRFGCEVYTRGVLTVIVGETAPPTAITNITLNGGNATTFCDTTNVTLTATLDTTMTITNPVFYWYVGNGTGQTLVSGQSGASLALTGLAPGTYTYYVGISSDEYCPTAEADRDSVTFTILPSSQAADIAVADVLVCQGIDAVLTPTSTLANPLFTWYFTNDTTQPIVSGSTVAGITYTISATGVLTVSGAVLAGSPYTYYVALTSDASCINAAGSLADAQVVVNDSGTPTTQDESQDFCLANNPTVANIQVNEPSVVFYDAPNAGNLLDPTTPLVNGGVYFAAFDPGTGCGSANRLVITVSVNDAGTPTTTDDTQNFCTTTSPTIANLQVNETNVSWYLTPNGGTVLATTELLVNGTTYYASLTDANGCESSVRLAVAVTLDEADTPTTINASQAFCLEDNPTIASIQVNETGVLWYAAPTGGTPLTSDTALVDGATYYGSLTDGATGCESAVRLAVSISVSDVATPTTTNTQQTFCALDQPTVADLSVNESNINWYLAATLGTPLALDTPLQDTVTYYAAQFDTLGGCESSVRLAISVTVLDPSTPTTTNATQSFCITENATVAIQQNNETNVIWYDTASGAALAPTTPLVNGVTYYAVQVDPASGCESTVRLAVLVQINDSGTPTTTNANQTFCQSANPTVSSLQVNESGVVFYDAASGGNLLAPDTALTNGATYYASFDPTSGCASGTRLAISVSVISVPSPTTQDDTQEFCLLDNPTVANIQVNQTGVVFYDAPTGGNVIPATATLTSGVYYATLFDPVSGCESSSRLAITVSFAGEIPATISGGADTNCVWTTVTYTTEAGMNNYSWSVSANGTITAGGQNTDNTVTVQWTAVGTGSVMVAYENPCSGVTSATRTFTLNSCSDLVITKVADNLTPLIDSNVTFTITVTNLGTGEFRDIQVDETLQSGYAFVSAVASLGTYSNVGGLWTIAVLAPGQSATLTIVATVLPTGSYANIATIITSNPDDIDVGNNGVEVWTDPICLIVYNEFSPNNDGANDTFRVDCIENYPDNKFEVFNRYGALVYSTRGYRNQWDGTANVSGAVNKDEKLPTGTYYYTLDLGNGVKKVGWLSITR